MTVTIHENENVRIETCDENGYRKIAVLSDMMTRLVIYTRAEHLEFISG